MCGAESEMLPNGSTETDYARGGKRYPRGVVTSDPFAPASAAGGCVAARIFVTSVRILSNRSPRSERRSSGERVWPSDGGVESS